MFVPRFSKTLTESRELPYWHMNIPVEKREEQCPEFLCKISERDKEIISVPASTYHYLTWDEVRSTIGRFRLAYDGIKLTHRL